MPKVQTAAFDAASIDTVRDCNAGAEIELRHPTSNKTVGVFISVLGRDSDVFREHVREQLDERNRRAFMAERKGKPLEPPTAAEQEHEAIELLATVVTGWRTNFPDPDDKTGKKFVSKPVMVFDGAELPCDFASVKKVLTNRLWVRRQVDDAIGDLDNFTKA